MLNMALELALNASEGNQLSSVPTQLIPFCTILTLGFTKDLQSPLLPTFPPAHPLLFLMSLISVLGLDDTPTMHGFP